MSTTKSIPTIYQGLNRDVSILKHCIIEDVHGGFYRFDSPEACHILKEAVQKSWSSFDAFSNENKQTLLTYHENLFKVEANKKMDLTEVASWCWYKIASLAVDRTTKVPTTSEGRKSTILNCKYFAGETVEGTGDVKTYQAIQCIKLFRQALETKGTLSGEPGKEVRSITEGDLKTYVEENAAELKTRQEPWRIFQYYRTKLINNKILRRE